MVYSKTLGVSYLYIRKHHRNNIMSKNINENTRNLGIRTYPDISPWNCTYLHVHYCYQFKIASIIGFYVPHQNHSNNLATFYRAQ